MESVTMVITRYAIHNDFGTYWTTDTETAEVHARNGFRVTAVTYEKDE